MLVLRRLKGEALHIDGPSVVYIRRVKRGEVWLAVEAERDVKVLRGELIERTKSVSGLSDVKTQTT